MKLSALFIATLKGRILSWLHSTEVTTYLFTEDMQQIPFATFRDGRLDQTPLSLQVPDDASSLTADDDG